MDGAGPRKERGPPLGGAGRITRVKNKQAAPIQITAEQILREASVRQDAGIRIPRQKITDRLELADYQLRKRKTFEDTIRLQRHQLGFYIKYAHWEEGQRDFHRARSVFERAIDVDYRESSVWIKYIEMEMRHKFINHARNLFDRAVTLLPRIDQFWYKYVYMEETLGNIAGARQAFERWMEWEPDEQAWLSYVKMETRYGELERARSIFERMIKVHTVVSSWLKYAKFEARLRQFDRARAVFERAIEELGVHATAELFTAFAKFEESCRETERARVIFKYALDNLPKQDAQELYKQFMAFEKAHGDREGIEDVIVSKRRIVYEEEVKANPHNYDAWFDYVRLEENVGDVERVREVYERAIANVPPAVEKRFWRRYIYLWINYALFEELAVNDAERVREVYRECIKLIPHKSFSFSKVWILFAHFEVRQRDINTARKILGHAIGVAPKESIFKAYVQLESQLGEIDRCRTIYEKYLQTFPETCAAWIAFADLERSLGEAERVRTLYELAIAQPLLDMPELLWKSFIDFEVEEEEYERAAQLYERLLERTKHVKVWISYAQFHSSIGEVQKAREVFQRADESLKGAAEQKEERSMILEAWRAFENVAGDDESQKTVASKIPTRVKKRRPTESGWEEYYDHIFPDEAAAAPNLKLLEMAHRWKRQRLEQEGSAV